MGAIAVFVSSLTILAILFGVKRWERRSGRVLLSRERARADELVMRTTLTLEDSVRRAFRAFVRLVVIRGIHTVTLAALYVVRFIERRLIALITLMRGRHFRVRRSQSTPADNAVPENLPTDASFREGRE